MIALQEEVVRSNYSFEEITNKLLFFNPAMLPMIHGQHGDELSFVDGKVDVSALSEPGVPLPCLYHLLHNGLLDTQRATPIPCVLQLKENPQAFEDGCCSAYCPLLHKNPQPQ